MKKIATLIISLISIFAYSQQCSITATDIFGNTTANLNCGVGSCIGLQTNVPEIFQTTSYTVKSQTYNTAISYNMGTPLGLYEDNKYSSVISLPFNFCFYGATYKSLVISSNGFISFDTSYAGEYSNPNIEPTWTNPYVSLPQNAIFGVMQDLNISKAAGSEIYYSVSGTAPCREFTISFYNAQIEGCTTETSTSQIVLHEFTNEIDINIDHKPIPCSGARFERSLIGIVNSDASDGLSPTNRNSGVWAANNESWKFSPSGNLIKPNIIWRKSSNAIVSTDSSFSACPTSTETYTVTLDYNVCSTAYTLKDDILVNYSSGGSAPVLLTNVVNDDHRDMCDNNADGKEDFDFDLYIKSQLTLNPTMRVTYHSSQSGADSGSFRITYVTNGKYPVYARVTSPTGCYSTAVINMDITFYDTIRAKEIKAIYCFDGTSDIKGENLLPYTTEMLLSLPSDVKTIGIYESNEDAIEGDPLKSKTIVDLEEDGDLVKYIFYVRFESNNGCYTIKRLVLEVYNPKAKIADLDVCDNNADGTETKTLRTYDASIASDPIKVTYLDPADPTKIITSYNFTQAATVINVQLDILDAVKGSCQRIIPVTFHLNSSPKLKQTLLNLNLGNICDNNNDNAETYDLTQHESYFFTSTGTETVTYYEKYNPTSQTFSNQVSSNYPLKKNATIYLKIASSKGCFSVGTIVISYDFLPAIVVSPTVLPECGAGFAYGVTFDMDKAISDLFDVTKNTILLSDIKATFHDSNSDANDNIPSSTINNADNTKKTYQYEETVWARLEDKTNHCYSVAPLVLRTKFPPRAKASAIVICDNNLDGMPDVNLRSKVYTDDMTLVSDINPDNIFTFYETQADITANNPIADPENYKPDSLPAIIYVRVESLPGCYDNLDSKAQITLTLGSKTVANPGPYTISQCDAGNDGKEEIDITKFENTILRGAKFNYYRSVEDLNKLQNEITGDKTKYHYDKNDAPNIYVMVTDSGLCPELVLIHVELKDSPIFNLDPYYFCPEVSRTIEPDLSFLGKIIDYTWKFPDGTTSKDPYIKDVKDAGQYSLTVTTENLCSYTDYFDVIAYEVPVIQQLVSLGANSYQVIATGSEKILYSKDRINWQESNIFENIKPGPVKFYVKFENSDCLGKVKTGLSIEIPNVITPNNDGINDTWTFSNLDVYDSPSTLKIYDRYGVLVYQQSGNDNFLWDGKRNGRALPTSSYWYNITLPDRTVNGWILLKSTE